MLHIEPAVEGSDTTKPNTSIAAKLKNNYCTTCHRQSEFLFSGQKNRTYRLAAI